MLSRYLWGENYTLNWSGYNNSFSVSALLFTTTRILLLAYILKVLLGVSKHCHSSPSDPFRIEPPVFLCQFVAFSGDSISRRAQGDQSHALSQSQIRSKANEEQKRWMDSLLIPHDNPVICSFHSKGKSQAWKIPRNLVIILLWKRFTVLPFAFFSGQMGLHVTCLT